MANRDVVFPCGRQALYATNRYSPAIRSNGLLFVSGQAGSRPDGSPEPEPEAQVRLAFENLDAILAAAGCTFDDVVDVTVVIVDPESTFKKACAVAQHYWGDTPHLVAVRRRRDVAVPLPVRDQGDREAAGSSKRQGVDRRDPTRKP